MSDFKIVQLLNPIQINTNIHPTGVYNAATTYGVGDSVSYGNSSYICILATTGNVPTNTTYWQLLASSATNKLSTAARNQTGVTIPAGSVVYFSGVSGNVPLLALSQANNEANSTRTIGITATAIANNANGEVIIFGLADSLDTFVYTAGSALWLSPAIPGGLTMTKPSAPDHIVFIGFCTRSHPTDGTIEVKVSNGFELEELHNVAISSLSDNQVLKYDAPNSLWKNETLVKGDVGLGSVDNISDLDKPVSTAQQIAIDAKVANNLTASTTVAPSKTAVNTALALKVAKAGDTMTGSLTVTGNNGVEFGGIQVNNTNLAGYCAINARADDGEVIQIAALNSGGSANAYGMWSVNEFGLYSKRSLNILTDTVGAEIKFATGAGATQVAKIDSTGKFSSNGISLNSGTVENVPTPTAATDAASKSYVDTGLATKQNSLGFIPANDSLSNLGGTAVNNSINPDSNLAYTLGASGLNWLSVGTKELTYDAYPNYDVELRKFVDSNIKNSLDYENRTLSDAGGEIVLEWKNCLIDKEKFDLIGNSFETVSKNLKQYDYTLTYTSGVLGKIDYTIPSVGIITKTLNYTSGVLTSVVLSGSAPASISLTKTLTYSSGVLTSIAYT